MTLNYRKQMQNMLTNKIKQIQAQITTDKISRVINTIFATKYSQVPQHTPPNQTYSHCITRKIPTYF